MKTISYLIFILLIASSCAAQKKESDLNPLIKRALAQKDDIDTTVSLLLLQAIYGPKAEYPSLGWKEMYNKDGKYKNYAQLINLDEDKEEELVIRIFDIHSEILFFKKDKQKHWKYIDHLTCPVIQEFGMAAPPGKFSLYPKEKLICLEHVPNHGSFIWHDEISLFSLDGFSLKKVFAVNYGATWPPIGDCGAELISNAKINVLSSEQIIVDWNYGLGCNNFCLNPEPDSFETIMLYSDSAQVKFLRNNNPSDSFEVVSIDGFESLNKSKEALQELNDLHIENIIPILLDRILTLEYIGNEKQKKAISYLKKAEDSWLKK